MPYLLEVSGSVSSSVDISTISSGSVVLSYDVPGRIDEDYDEWFARYNESGSLGLNSAAESGSFSTSTVVSTSEVSSSYFVLELENSQTIEVPHSHCHLYYYKTSENKWLWVGNNSKADLSINDYLFGSDGNPVKITGITHYYDVVKSFVVFDVEEIDTAFYGNSSDGYSILKHNGNRGGGGGGQNAPPERVGCWNPSEDSVDVEWDEAIPEVPGEKYNVRHATNQAMAQNLVTINGAVTCDGSSHYSFTVGSLNSNTTYYFQVQQGASSGGTPSDWTPAPPASSTTTAGAPDAPSTPGISQKDEDSITFTFSSTGATSYNLYFGTNNPPTNVDNGTGQAGTSKQYTGLSNAITYHFRVTATNSSGTSGYSTVQSTTTNTLAGGTPVLSSVTPISQTVSWTNPAGTYAALLYQDTSTNPTDVETSGTGLTSYSHTGLTPGTTYYYRTRTQGYYHDGFYSDYSSVTSGAAASLSAPTNLAYTANSTEQITITWTDPTYSQRIYIEYYYDGTWETVQPNGSADYIADGVESWVLTNIDEFDEYVNEKFTMTANTLYQFRMRSWYDGSYSSYTSTFNAYTKPGKPTLTATAVSDTAIDISWTDPGGNALTETYTLQYTNGTDLQVATSPRSYSDAELVQSTLYQYRVFTSTAAGTSAYPHSTASATTQAGPDPTAGDLLRLGALGHATGNSDATSTSDMNTISGGTSTVSMRDYYSGGCSTSLAGPGVVPFGGTETVSMQFINVGTEFLSRIASRGDQFTWTSSNSNIVSVDPNSDYTAVITGHLVNQTATITCVWDANYNGSHSSISTNRTATIDVTVAWEW